MEKQRIKTIDMSQPWPKFCRDFGNAFRDIGFAVVTNHGIPTKHFNDTYRVMRKAFALSEKQKRKCEIPAHTSGFIPYGTEHAKDDLRPDQKEIWDVRHRGPFYRPSQFPRAVKEFRGTTARLFKDLDRLSLQLLQALDVYLGFPKQLLSGMAIEGDSLLRLLHYPAMKKGEPGMRSAPHEDINLITLLPVATAPGLQVKGNNGRWYDVTSDPNMVIVNAGDMLKMYSKHIGQPFPSTTHQVITLPGERYSMPYFVHPRGDVLLKHGTTAGAYLHQRLVEIGLIKP